MVYSGHTLKVVTLGGMLGLSPLAWAANLDVPDLSFGQEITASRQILDQPADDNRNAYRQERQGTRNRVQRSDLGRVLLNALFPEKIIRMKKLDAGPAAPGLHAPTVRLHWQYQLGLAYQGTMLKLRTQDDVLGVSMGNNHDDGDAPSLKVGVKLRW